MKRLPNVKSKVDIFYWIATFPQRTTTTSVGLVKTNKNFGWKNCLTTKLKGQLNAKIWKFNRFFFQWRQSDLNTIAKLHNRTTEGVSYIVNVKMRENLKKKNLVHQKFVPSSLQLGNIFHSTLSIGLDEFSRYWWCMLKRNFQSSNFQPLLSSNSFNSAARQLFHKYFLFIWSKTIDCQSYGQTPCVNNLTGKKKQKKTRKFKHDLKFTNVSSQQPLQLESSYAEKKKHQNIKKIQNYPLGCCCAIVAKLIEFIHCTICSLESAAK